MKQAFLITAYRDFEFLERTVRTYIRGGLDCFIHIDKKSAIPVEFLDWARKQEGVYIYTRYKVNWGSYKHISAILYLMKEALKMKDYGYFHIVSANAFITRPINEITAFFEVHSDKNFIQIVDLDIDDINRVIDPWFIYYHFLHFYNKRTKKGNDFDYYLEKVQRKLGIRRKKRYQYKGLLYSHFTKDFVIYALDYVRKNPGYFNNLKMCNISEEFFFQNIIMYSPYKDTIFNSNLIYDVWNSGGVAQFLTKVDFNKIMTGEYLFARKFGPESDVLYRMICEKAGINAG